jgi:hypothetical protein
MEREEDSIAEKLPCPLSVAVGQAKASGQYSAWSFVA